jgi:hypothetical protein
MKTLPSEPICTPRRRVANDRRGNTERDERDGGETEMGRHRRRERRSGGDGERGRRGDGWSESAGDRRRCERVWNVASAE